MADVLSMNLTQTPTMTGGVVGPSLRPLRRVAIIGTAQSWNQCPWADQSLEVWGLNDAYMIGVPRANRWYDLHPPSQMTFRPSAQRAVPPAEVPIGGYMRPHGHLEWLASRPMSVYIQHARPDWPTSRTFPIEEILAFFQPHWPWRLTRRGVIEPGKDYEVSTPSWMLMHAIMEGYTEIHVYGIHLATHWEYVQQRPNFEWLLGLAAGRGIKIVLPLSAPICQSPYRYAYELKADIPLQQVEQQVLAVKMNGLKLRQQLAALPWYARGQKADIERQLQRREVELLDLRQAGHRASVTVAR